ncbi:MAG: aldehyde dehydrogenase family protein [Saprospiraceae bacterium]
MSQLSAVDIKIVSEQITRIFNLQKNNQYKVARTKAKERKAKIKKIKNAIQNTYREAIKEASFKDFKKHEAEVDLTEIFPIVASAKHTMGRLSGWMRDERVDTPLAQLGMSSWIKYEPKGVVLIISPWNFAFNLTFIPLISAIAAGNTVIIKPSENTSHSSALMKQIIDDIFHESEVAVIEGAIPETSELLKKPFNHIFFTGAPSIGKIVMKAAAEHLTSVSLELGGKCPTIVDKSANIKDAAAKIAWAKGMNNGQICIAPDYVYVHESVKDQFVSAYKKYTQDYYGTDIQDSDSYNRIVNDNHFRRLKGYMDDALAKDAVIEFGGNLDEKDNYVSPTVLSNLSDDALVWQNEIFGPILPIRTFKDIKEPVDFVNKGEKPLALYVYCKNKKNTNYVVNNTRSGGVVINHNAVHYFNNNLPFGGSNNSGIGKGMGIFGFRAFSNAKSIMKQWSPIDGMENFRPPFTNTKKKLIAFAVKYLT